MFCWRNEPWFAFKRKSNALSTLKIKKEKSTKKEVKYHPNPMT